MNTLKNYYLILNSKNTDDIKDIKKSYYKLSKIYHPDVNKEEGHLFNEITEAWEVLNNSETKSEYDKKSKWGKDYSELEELFNINLEYNHKDAEEKWNKVKNREILDIILKIKKEDFKGSLEFPRWVICPTCKGNGKDTKTKIQIKTPDSKIKWFEADDGCDFCDGTGKDWYGNTCNYCEGKGKAGILSCKKCEGEGRILGKQKLKNIKLSNEEETKIDSMGHWKNGRVGNLILKIENI